MSAIEKLLIAEDDVPMRLVALALGAPVDARMREALAQLFVAGPERAQEQLWRLARDLGLAGQVTPVLAAAGPPDDQLEGVHHLFVEGAPVTAAALARAPALRFIQKHGEDCRNIDLRAAAARGVPVATLRRWANSSVAEHTFLLLLALARRLLSAHRAAQVGRAGVAQAASRYNWARLDGLWPLRGATLGIVGLGEIGREVARRARAFEMRVLYTQRRRLSPDLEQALGAEFRPLASLLADSDVVTLHLPLTPETQHILGESELKQMRRGAILINTSRGRLVDEAALVAALRAGHLGGAGLDVRHGEPPRDASGLAELETVVLTPHVAGGTGLELLRDTRAVLENIARVRRGEPIPVSPQLDGQGVLRPIDNRAAGW